MVNPKKEETAGLDADDSAIGRLRRWIASTPTGAFLAIAPVVFVADFLNAWTLEEWISASGPLEPLIDAALDLVVVLPILLFLFVLPTAQYVREREAAERALLAAGENLERRVRERTAELEESNDRLRQEAKQRRRAQEAVAFQASLLDAVEEAVAATDPEGRVLYWNRFAEQLYGWKAQEVEARRLEDVIAFRHPDGQPLEVLGQCKDGVSWSGEVDAVRRDASHFPAYVVCSPLDSGTCGYVCISVDISELTEAVQALGESEEKYSSLVENAPTGIFAVLDNKIAFVNPKLTRMLQYSSDELVGTDPLLLVHPEDRDKVAEIGAKRAAGASVAEEYECRLLTKTGHVRGAAVRGTLIRYRGRLATLGTVQDVTDRQRMETELHQLSARLLTIQEEERRRVARDLHDSLGPTLSGIKFMVEAALGGPWPEERRSGIQQLRSLVPTIQDAMEEVRRISTDLRPAILDDVGLLPTMAWHLRELQKGHPRLAVEEHLNAAECDVPLGLRTPVFRILQEATNNVAKHSRASRLVVGLDIVEGAVRLRVKDDGVGFNPGAPRREANSGGLGLTSMRERAELSGGTFSLASAPGAGTTVEVVWPVDAAVSA